MTPLTITPADYADPADVACVLALLDAYSREPFGAGKPLDADVRARLSDAFAARPTLFSLLARADGTAIGLANCIESFSTFAARPLVNLHDLYVVPACRGQGVASALLAAVERAAHARGAVGITLEVLAENARAQAAYRRAGFAPAALFWKKALPNSPPCA